MYGPNLPKSGCINRAAKIGLQKSVLCGSTFRKVVKFFLKNPLSEIYDERSQEKLSEKDEKIKEGEG